MLNKVMDALQFDYLDYPKVEEEATSVKRKRIVSIMKRQAKRSMNERKKEIAMKPKMKAADQEESS
jgi:hypothetical protein